MASITSSAITTLSSRPIAFGTNEATDPQNQTPIAPVEPLEFAVSKGLLLRRLWSISNTGGFSQVKLSIASLVTLKPIDLLKSLRFEITCCSTETIASASLSDNTGNSVSTGALWSMRMRILFSQGTAREIWKGSAAKAQTTNAIISKEVSSWPTWKNYEEVTFCWMRDYDFLPGYNMSTPKNQKEHQTVGKLIKLMQLGFICWVLSSFTGNLVIFSLMAIYLLGTYFIGGVVWGAAKDAGHTDNFKQMIGYGIHAISWPIWIFGTHDFFRLKRHRNK
jgi:hypothetical protein